MDEGREQQVKQAREGSIVPCKSIATCETQEVMDPGDLEFYEQLIDQSTCNVSPHVPHPPSALSDGGE